MYMPAKSNCSEVYPKNMELRAFIPSPFSILQTLVWPIFNLCYTPKTTQHNSVFTCPYSIWLKIVPNWSAIDCALNTDFVMSQLCDIMSIKLKINLKHTFFVHTAFAIVGQFFSVHN